MSVEQNFTYRYNCSSSSNSEVYGSYICGAGTCSNGVTRGLTSYDVFSNTPLTSLNGCQSLSLVSQGINTVSCSSCNSFGCSNCSYSFTTSGGGLNTGGGNTPSGVPAPYNGNIVESVSGATVVLDDSALASGVGEPMFFWYGQLLNAAIKFFPVIIVVSMFRLIYGYLKNLGNKNSLESKKSLDNK